MNYNRGVADWAKSEAKSLAFCRFDFQTCNASLDQLEHRPSRASTISNQSSHRRSSPCGLVTRVSKRRPALFLSVEGRYRVDRWTRLTGLDSKRPRMAIFNWSNGGTSKTSPWHFHCGLLGLDDDSHYNTCHGVRAMIKRKIWSAFVVVCVIGLVVVGIEVAIGIDLGRTERMTAFAACLYSAKTLLKRR